MREAYLLHSCSNMTENAQRAGYLPTLDGWRALAVLIVIFSHASRGGLCGVRQPLPVWCQLGGHGVSVFFSISGFLITSRLLGEWHRHGTVSLSGFYVRRACRILPPAMLFLAVVGVLGAIGWLAVSEQSWLAAAFFVRDYPWWGGDLQWYTAHYWSLAVEEKFYLIWPVLLVAVGIRRAVPLAIGLAVAVLLWRLADGHWQIVSGALVPSYTLEARWDTRFDGILWGCLLGLALDRDHWRSKLARWLAPGPSVLLWAGFICAIILFPDHSRDALTLETVVVPLLLASTVLHPGRPFAMVLEHPALRWVGVRSYGFYLWQQLFFPDTAFRPLGFVQLLPISLLLLTACVMASYRWIEVPLVRAGYRFVPRRPVVAATGVGQEA